MPSSFALAMKATASAHSCLVARALGQVEALTAPGFVKLAPADELCVEDRRSRCVTISHQHNRHREITNESVAARGTSTDWSLTRRRVKAREQASSYSHVSHLEGNRKWVGLQCEEEARTGVSPAEDTNGVQLLDLLGHRHECTHGSERLRTDRQMHAARNTAGRVPAGEATTKSLRRGGQSPRSHRTFFSNVASSAATMTTLPISVASWQNSTS